MAGPYDDFVNWDEIPDPDAPGPRWLTWAAVEKVLREQGGALAGDELRIPCPIHDSDHQPSLSINVGDGPSRGSWQCFACGAAGRIDPETIPPRHEWAHLARGWWGGSGGRSWHAEGGGEPGSRFFSSNFPSLRAGEWRDANDEEADWTWQTLENRGIPRALAEASGAKPATVGFTYHAHVGIAFPAFAESEEPSAWLFRALDVPLGSPCATACAKRFKSGSRNGVFYVSAGEMNYLRGKSGKLWLTEGPMDALSLPIIAKLGLRSLPIDSTFSYFPSTNQKSNFLPELSQSSRFHANNVVQEIQIDPESDVFAAIMGNKITDRQCWELSYRIWWLRDQLGYRVERIVLVPDADSGGQRLAKATTPLQRLGLPVFIADSEAAFGGGLDPNDALVRLLRQGGGD